MSSTSHLPLEGLIVIVSQLHYSRHPWADRNLHLVCVRLNHHRCCRLFPSNGGRLHHRHAKDHSAGDVHVQYALRVQVRQGVRALTLGLLTPLCSILYKTKLPFILVFNKTDVQTHDFAVEWMQDFEAFQAALATHQGTTDDEGEPTYMNSLMNSMSLVLDEFYKHLKVRLVPLPQHSPN